MELVQQGNQLTEVRQYPLDVTAAAAVSQVTYKRLRETVKTLTTAASILESSPL